MVRPSLLCLGVAILFVGALQAQDNRVQLPGRPSPTFNVVTGKNDATGEVQLTRTVTGCELVPVTKTVQVNGLVQAVVSYEKIQTQALKTTTFSLKKNAVYNTEGKKLEAAEALRRLEPGSVVLESANDQPVDPVYLRAVRPETLILVTTQPMTATPMTATPVADPTPLPPVRRPPIKLPPAAP